MLIISRKRNESIHIGEDIEIVISELTRTVVKVAISAPRGTRVLRGEIYRAVAEANRAASEALGNDGPATESLAAFVSSGAKVPLASQEASDSASAVLKEEMRDPTPPIVVSGKEESVCLPT